MHNDDDIIDNEEGYIFISLSLGFMFQERQNGNTEYCNIPLHLIFHVVFSRIEIEKYVKYTTHYL